MSDVLLHHLEAIAQRTATGRLLRRVTRVCSYHRGSSFLLWRFMGNSLQFDQVGDALVR